VTGRRPELSWSISRQRALERCPRAYYCSYYLAHEGWRRDASPAARQAYRLKKLTSLDQLLGLQIDARGRELEAAARAGLPLPSAAELEERTLRPLRAVWRASTSGRSAFDADPRSVIMLRAIYLGQEAQAQAEAARLREKAAACLEALLDAPHWRCLRECGQRGCVPIPEFASCRLDGLTVYAAADLAYVHQGVLHAVDWKSGREDESNELQVLVQLHCLEQTFPDVAGLPSQGHLEYLVAGRAELVQPAADYRERVTQVVREGITLMRSYLEDDLTNEPRSPEAFPRHESGLCRSCTFAPLCADL
jgi:hypothetical protein